MRKKINAQFAIMTAVAVILTVMLSMAVYYDVFRREIMNSLRADAMVLNSPGVLDDEDQIDVRLEPLEGVRVTVINPDGTVCYDSSADIGAMDNHGERPEIQKAFETGEGEIIRRSDTLQKNTYYYAVAMSNGCVLRVAKDAGNMWSFLLPLFPVLGIMGILLLLVCVALAHFLTKSIIMPVEQMAAHMDDEEYRVTYREMEPFMDTIRKQHQDIMKNTMMRQEFTANVSHELKTPLTAISGYSELIESGFASGEDAVRFAGEIHKSSQRLLTLINDILRLSELDAADDNFVTERLDLYELAVKCADMLEFSAEKHDVTLSLEGRPGCFAQVNREMAEEIMYNLCSNAIRYNVPGGRVVMSVAREGNHAALTVEDTGIGIPQEDQKRIFERFYRVDKSRSKSTGGTGLGLAIVKHAAARHGAEIGLWSRPGEGTRIKIVFPEENL